MIATIIIFAFLSTIGMSLIALLLSRVSYSNMQLDRLKSLYLAEAGIYQAIWELRYDVSENTKNVGTISRTELGDGHFWTIHDFQTATITATGEVNDVQRTVQIAYSSI